MNNFLFDAETRELRFERGPAERRLIVRPSAPVHQRERERAGERKGLVELLDACGAILIVALGLIFVFVTSLVALNTVQPGQRATTMAAAFGVIGTLVGTYFGHKLGSAGKKEAESARDAESVRALELAARGEPKVATDALDRAHKRIER